MSNTVLIAAGGTGGHIYPAIAIAKSLKKLQPDLQIQFYGCKGGMEEKIVPREGYTQHLVQLGRLNHNVGKLERLLTLFQLPFVILWTVLLLLRLKPRFVFGVGGACSAPLILAAWITGIPRYIWEPNALPGMANRWVSKFANKAYVVFEEAKKFFQGIPVESAGVPVREEFEKVLAAEEKSGPPMKVFVFGGSQGSVPINKVVSDCLLKHKAELQNFRFLHQAGYRDYENLQRKYKDIDKNHLELREYVYDMHRVLAEADLVICRSGIMSISEIAAVGRASLLIPLPSSADDHQKKNAEQIQKIGGGRMILQSEFSEESLWSQLNEFLQNPHLLQEMGENVKTFHRSKASDVIATNLIEETR